MTRTGQAFELRTSERPTAGSASSSSRSHQKAETSSKLLPTPSTGDMTSGQPAEIRRAHRHQVRLADLFVIAPPLPNDHQTAADTASTRRSRSPTNPERRRHGAERLGHRACYATAADVANTTRHRGNQGLTQSARQQRGSDAHFDGHPVVADGQPVDREAAAFDWREYEPAIQQWESVVGRPAPHPVEPGTHGQPRLASRFVEWLMGLPAGYVTDLGLPRSAELRALGNGVVLQQAVAALNQLTVAALHTQLQAAQCGAVEQPRIPIPRPRSRASRWVNSAHEKLVQ